ncbi:type II toxin-antitoxin system VapC family toxin [candidate division KSB1 bacterium]|nr:type II toxin-antitoxin system VapC family toxin [candidate division KSB1 bacterium]MBL7092527.1 type II toxin-antitoxin system VapC family toxin [candidate division KSB1 bacterium]
MEKIFVDANAWIALSSKRDQFHDSAVKLNKKLLKEKYQYVTSNFVLDETYTGLVMKVGHFAAVDFGERIRDSKITTIIHIAEELEYESWKLFKQHKDKFFSFTDCTSFVIMRQLNIYKTFTNDHHFEQMGFSILLK